MSYVDFTEVKRLASIDQVASWLGLNPKHDRCQCPINEGEKRELVLTPAKELFYCFGCRKGGDLIELTAHVKRITQKAAALEIQAHFHGYRPAEKGLPPDGLPYLEAEHPAVQALGMSAKTASQLGIGYAPRGTMIKRVLFPLRDGSGKLVGYLGYAQDGSIKLPTNLLG